jgi:hypothetical protein
LILVSSVLLHLLAQPASAQPALPKARDEIEFRILTPSDFLAAHPPVEAAHPAGFNAVSCVRIGWPAGLPIEYSVRGSGAAAGVSAVMPGARFVAFFDRQCSWWSSQPEDPSYALLHEQVHFAIAEHAARELTQAMRRDARVVRGYGSSRDQARSALEQRLLSLATEAQIAARREHTAFDSETSRDRSPEVQQRWVDRYETHLGVEF